MGVNPANATVNLIEDSLNSRQLHQACRDSPKADHTARHNKAVFLTSNLQVNFGTGKEKGSGLGPLLVKGFVKANHGRVWLESEEGSGTTFFISLPMAA